MRMWMLNPKMMCTQHITGEHSEIHKHRHNFVKKHKIGGRFKRFNQIEPESMQARHDELAQFLNHKSPYQQPDLSYLLDDQRYAKVDYLWNVIDLFTRCKKCRSKIINFFSGAICN